MKKHQVEKTDQTWRGDREHRNSDQRQPTERMVNKENADRKRAEYLRLHDDDEAELGS
jgi:hypothetical protein